MPAGLPATFQESHYVGGGTTAALRESVVTKLRTSRVVSQSSGNLTPRGAIAFGALFMLCGTFPVLAGLGILHGSPAPDVPPWVVIASGSMFILAGLAIINGYAVAGGVQADGNLSDSAPLIVRVTQFLLGVAIIGLMFAVFAWVAFGPGERHFSSSVSISGFSTSTHSSARTGRIVFGIGAGFIGLFLVAAVVSGAKRLWRDIRGGPKAQ